MQYSNIIFINIFNFSRTSPHPYNSSLLYPRPGPHIKFHPFLHPIPQDGAFLWIFTPASSGSSAADDSRQVSFTAPSSSTHFKLAAFGQVIHISLDSFALFHHFKTFGFLFTLKIFNHYDLLLHVRGWILPPVVIFAWVFNIKRGIIPEAEEF